VQAGKLGEILGAGKEAEVFACGGERVVKLYRSPAAKPSAFREAAALAVVERLGIPAPRVHAVRRFGDRWGVVSDRVHGPTFGIALAADPHAPELAAMVALQVALHAAPGAGLPGLKAGLAAKLDHAEALPPAGRKRLRERLATLPDGDRLCHGDFHPWNLLGEPGRAVIVDWLDAAQGPPLADAGRSYLLLSMGAPRLAQPYLGAYLAASGASSEAVLAWLPVLAGARLAEGVPDEAARLLKLAGRD
jgi:aminoglycoside phosphotransferase (APT) family kinase protein